MEEEIIIDSFEEYNISYIVTSRTKGVFSAIGINDTLTHFNEGIVYDSRPGWGERPRLKGASHSSISSPLT